MKTAVLTVRLSDEELEQLDLVCSSYGQTRGDALGSVVWCYVWMRPKVWAADLRAGDGPCAAGRPHRVPVRLTPMIFHQLRFEADGAGISVAGLVRALVRWAGRRTPRR